MKRKIMKLVSVVLALLVMLLTLTVSGAAAERKTTDYEVGDIIEFGSYPQSEVTDARLKTELNKLEKTWISYDYYSGEGWYSDATAPGDWMQYTDVEYLGAKYRGVKFIYYRPRRTCLPLSNEWDSNLPQCENGYNTNITYWFKYESLKWRILDPYSGLVLSEEIIDSQAFQNKLYYFEGYFFNDAQYNNWGCDYETSSMRAWLNNDFYNTAFSDAEKSNVITTTIKNDGVIDPQFNGKDTEDKVFALSLSEFENDSYKLKGIKGKATDYAKCQGVYVNDADSEVHWRLRTADYCNYVLYVYDGESGCYDADGVSSYVCSVDVTDVGIRPAMVLDSVKHKHSYTSKVTTEPTCTKEGVKTFTCSCGDKYTEAIPVLAHTYNKGVVTKAPTCVEAGVKTYTCICGDFYTEDIPVVDHKAGAWTVTVEPTIEAEGKKVKKCTVCKVVLAEEIISKLNPADFIDISVNDVAIDYKSTDLLNAKFGKLDGVDYTVEYISSNTDVVSVDEDGNITATGTGEAEITVRITDEFGNKAEDTCKVTVSYAWWQWLIIIFLFGWIWY